ncbi:MAG: hypothetical protein ABMA64_11095 [Myxococcota bacterium]
MIPAELVASGDHRDRMKRLVALDADTWEALAAGPVWHRVLAAWAGYGHRDPHKLARGCTDPSLTVRRAALRVAVRALDDTGLATLFTAVTSDVTRRELAQRLARRRVFGPVDAWVAGRLADDPHAAELLPWCSDARVRAELERFADHAPLQVWGRLCKLHPGPTAELLQVKILQSERLDPRWEPLVHALVPELARIDPDRIVAWIPELVARGQNPQVGSWTAALWIAARARPAATFDALRQVHAAGKMPAPGAFAAVSFDRDPHHLGAERISWLIANAWTALPDGRHGIRWLARLSAADQVVVRDAWLTRGRGTWGAFLLRGLPSDDPRRAAAFTRWVTAARDAHGLVSPHLLRDLPTDLRHAEARRHLAHPSLGTNPQARMPYASLLPFGEAGVALDPFVKHPDGAVRALALAAWIDTARADRRALSDALALVAARRFEQDPVRGAMLAALERLPHTVWTADALLLLGEVLGHAWDAGDLSYGTAASAERLAAFGFRLDPAWGAAQVERALAVRGSVSAHGWWARLPRAERVSLIPAIERIATRWTSRERWGALAWLCANLGRDLPLARGIGAHLDAVAREAPFPGFTATALDLLARYDRRQFAATAEALLEQDVSAIVFPSIATWVSCRRQRWLDRVVSGEIGGRWSTGKTRWIVLFDRGFATWTADQQERYADALDRGLGDPEASVPDALRCVIQLAPLAYADPDHLHAWIDDPRPPVREWAVRCLGRRDGAIAAPVLLRCLGDDRARWAIYALRRALAELPPDEVLKLLLAAPRSKVTVQKEVVRLIGELGTADAHRALLALVADRPHRDVRIALLRALWSHLERDDTWPVFDAAAADADWVVASRLAEVGTSALSPTADARFCVLLARLLTRPEPEARLHLLTTVGAARVRDADRALQRAITARIGAPTPAERALALSAAIGRAYERDVDAIVTQVVAAGPLAVLEGVDAVTRASWYDARVDRLRRGLVAALAPDPAWAAAVVRLHLRRDEGEVVALLRRLSRDGLLGYDVTAAALGVIAAALAPGVIEGALRPEGDPALRRLGLGALVAAASGVDGWTQARRAALDQYRADASPGVRGAARAVRPPEPA